MARPTDTRDTKIRITVLTNSDALEVGAVTMVSDLNPGADWDTLAITPNKEGWRVCVGCPNTSKCEDKGCQWPSSAVVAASPEETGAPRS